MGFGISEGNLQLEFTAFGTVIIAVLLLLLGYQIKKRVKFCQKYCLPAPVIGGALFAFANLMFHLTGRFSIGLDSSYQNDMQFMFFTIVGFGASFTLLKKGGKKLILYFLLTGALILLQTFLSIVGANITGIPKVYGLLCGPIPLAGGHGSVAAYGEMIENLGYDGGIVVGMAAATFGLIIGSFFGGPLCARLVRKYHLQPVSDIQGGAASGIADNKLTTKAGGQIDEACPAGTHLPDRDKDGGAAGEVTVQAIFKHLALIGGFMVIGGVLGTYLGKGLSGLTGGSISLPGFCGPMLAAFLVRNVNDKVSLFHVNEKILSVMEELSLGIFLTMAMISLKLWELASLAVPMLVILLIETAAVLLFIYFVVFRLMGKDYNAAACCAGLCGHGFGATPNGIANLGSVSERFGYPKLAFLIVPIVGGFLQDIFLVPVNVFLINFLA